MRMIGAFGSFFGFGGVFIPGEIVGIAPHAHQLATHMQATLTRSDGMLYLTLGEATHEAPLALARLVASP